MTEDFKNEEKREFKVPETNKGKGYGLIYLFLFTFVFVIILVSAFLKNLTPNMDLEIGENPVALMNQRGDEEDYNIRSQIDQRLKMIQNDEEMPGVSENRDYETPEEIVNRLREDATKDKKNEEVILNTKEENKSPEIEPVRVKPADIVREDTIIKIYIGQYSDIQKAVDMQANIIDSEVNASPIIKEVNGYYTVQAGAFSNPESAKNLTNELINAGFAAKMVKEIK